MKPFYWCIRGLFKTYFKIFYHHTVYGLEHSVEGRAIIAPNHTSFFDPPIVAISSKEEIHFLARKSLFSSSLFGSLITKLNAHPINPSSQEISTLKLIYRLLKENKKVVIFPEGSRSKDGSLLPIKQGIGMLSLHSDAPIIPVYIDGAYSIWNRTRKFPKISGKTACVFGTPIIPGEFKHLKNKEAQNAIAEQVTVALHNLKRWYDKGAIGSPP